MRRTFAVCLLSLFAGVAWGSTSYADWLVRAPFVTVGGGRGGVSVRAPFVDVRVGTSDSSPPFRMLPVTPTPPPTVVKAPTLEEFAASFKPAAGTYEVTIQHSRTCCPVTICFTLPPGCPKVCLHRHQLDFEYRGEDVRIRCQIGGAVKVSYH